MENSRKKANNRTVKIGHVSDLHLPLPRNPSPMQLVGKRILGFANLTFNRGHTHKLERLEKVLGDLVSRKPDLVVITGDISNLCLGNEYETVSEIFSSQGLTPENTVVIPGNHDRYTPIADFFSDFEKGMARWLPAGFDREVGYPIIKRVGPVALAALDTAVWRGPVRAAGKVCPDQVLRLKRFLEQTESEGRAPLIAMHHPPYDLGLISSDPLKHYRAGLAGYEKIHKLLEKHPATVIHGHMHKQLHRKVGDSTIIGVTSGSNDTREENTQAAYNLYELSEKGLLSATAVRPDWSGQREVDLLHPRTAYQAG